MWRVGTKVPVNIYKNDQIAGQCQTPELAKEIVNGLNELAFSRDKFGLEEEEEEEEIKRVKVGETSE